MSPQLCCSKLICCLTSRSLKTRGEDFIKRCPGEFYFYTTVPSIRRTLLQTPGNPRLTPLWWNPAQSLRQGRAEWAARGGQQAQTSLPCSGTQAQSRASARGELLKSHPAQTLLQPNKAQLKCLENHCFIITGLASLNFKEPLSRVSPESPQDSSFGGEVWYKLSPLQSNLRSSF